jgi:pyruvate dehydrogenase E1 component
VTELLASAPGPVVAVSDFMKAVPDQIARFIPALSADTPTGKGAAPSRARPFVTLGTDGFGRSDTREALRRFFETDEAHIVVATLGALSELGEVEPALVAKAIKEYGLDADVDDPRTR